MNRRGERVLRRLFARLLAAALMVGLSVGPGTVVARAEDVTERTEVKVTKLEIVNEQHEPQAAMRYESSFYLRMEWDASSYGTELKRGDYFDITLPSQMRFPSDSGATNFDVTDADGNAVARAKVVPEGSGGGSVRLTFTDYVEGKARIRGALYLAAKFVSGQIQGGEENHFSVIINGEVTTVAVTVGEIVGPKEEKICKWANAVSNEEKAVWALRINHMREDMKNVVITDTLSEPTEQFQKNSFLLREVEYNELGYSVNIVKVFSPGELEPMLKFFHDEGGREFFVLKLGDIGTKQYRLDYESSYTKGKKLKNTVKLEYDGGEKVISVIWKSAESSGNASGEGSGRIRLVKVDAEDPTVPLADARFIVRDENGRQVTELITGTDGTAETKKMQAGTYYIEEIRAPDGYLLPEKAFPPVLLREGAVERLTLPNRRNTVSRLTVYKKWQDNDNRAGARPESIEITLIPELLDSHGTVVGVPDQWKRTVTVRPDADGFWYFEFTDLPSVASISDAVRASPDKAARSGCRKPVAGASASDAASRSNASVSDALYDSGTGELPDGSVIDDIWHQAGESVRGAIGEVTGRTEDILFGKDHGLYTLRWRAAETVEAGSGYTAAYTRNEDGSITITNRYGPGSDEPEPRRGGNSGGGGGGSRRIRGDAAGGSGEDPSPPEPQAEAEAPAEPDSGRLPKMGEPVNMPLLLAPLIGAALSLLLFCAKRELAVEK